MMTNRESDADSNTLLELRGICKSFPGVQALQDVDLSVFCGEIHAIVGENGAGKSTLMQILAGVYPPDSGSVGFDGKPGVAFRNERESQLAGIALVFQERSLFGPLTVADNVYTGRQPVNAWGKIDRGRLYRDCQVLLDLVGLEVTPDSLVEYLSPAQQQLVEIAKAISLTPKLILLDEPTAALSRKETERLFYLIRQLREQGVGILYISHHLQEIFELADRVTILKDGKGQGTYGIDELTPTQLVTKMIGRPPLETRSPRNRIQRDVASAEETPLLKVRGLFDDPIISHNVQLHDIELHVQPGEIVGLAGLVGAGRTELGLSIYGARPFARGEIWWQGKPIYFRSPGSAVKAGIAYVPEDRKDSGLFLEMSIAENMLSSGSKRFGSGWIHLRAERQAVRDMCHSLQVRFRNIDEPVKNLSGGNQQKIVLGRCLLTQPKLLIVDEPTRGVDVGAKSEIHELLRGLADKGTGILLISSDLPEVLAVSDRIVIMRRGRIAGSLPREEATEQRVMEIATLGESQRTEQMHR